MPTWLIIIIVVAVIGAIIGFFSSDDDDKAAGATSGAIVGAMGCGYFLFQLLLAGLSIWFVIWLFSAIFL